MVTMDAVTAAKLREPFKPTEIGKLPRIWCGACRNAQYKVCDKHKAVRCDGCNNKITDAHLHLDYVGHAEITDRLLQVDPEWSWEPLAWDEQGLPRFDADNGLWIKLTVAGVPRLGYGDAEGKRGPAARKETIGDALRNAAMRFGVGIDLWGAKFDAQVAQADEPAGQQEAPAQKANGNGRQRPATAGATGTAAETSTTEPNPTVDAWAARIGAANNRDQLTAVWKEITAANKAGELVASAADQVEAAWKARRDLVKAVAHMFVLLGKAGITDRDERLHWYANIVGRHVESTNDLALADIEKVSAKTQAWIDQEEPATAGAK